MKKLSILTVIIGILCVNLQAQQKSDVQKIKDWYYKVKEAIKYSKEHKLEGKLYCDITSKNVNGASWSAIGEYSSKIQTWYNDDPDYAKDIEENPRECLVMVIENTEKESTRKYYAEYLFMDGQLAFVFYKRNDVTLRLYVKNNKVIKQIGKLDKDYDVTEYILQNGEVYMQSFLASFGIWNE